MKTRKIVLGVALGVVLAATAGCTASQSRRPGASPSPTPAPSEVLTLAPSPTLAPTASPTLAPTDTPEPSPTPTPRPVGHWVKTGSMGTPRFGDTATLLQDGRVLVAGGWDRASCQVEGCVDPRPLRTAELYDPRTGRFTPTGSMSAGRAYHTATLLQNGRVLIVGGVGPANAEIYDPGTGKFTTIANLRYPRAIEHTATLLADGQVLIAGGRPNAGALDFYAAAELYDPKTGQFTATGSMTIARGGAIAVRLRDGHVLIAGGENADGALSDAVFAELYDPIRGTFSRTGSMSASTQDVSAPAGTLLPDGRVLITGSQSIDFLPSAGVYDPVSGSFAARGPMVGAGQAGFLLRDGRVLVVGDLDVSELYDPATGSFVSAGSRTEDFCSGPGVVLNDGRVLIAGGNPCGSDWGVPFAESYLYVP